MLLLDRFLTVRIFVAMALGFGIGYFRIADTEAFFAPVTRETTILSSNCSRFLYDKLPVLNAPPSCIRGLHLCW